MTVEDDKKRERGGERGANKCERERESMSACVLTRAPGRVRERQTTRVR